MKRNRSDRHHRIAWVFLLLLLSCNKQTDIPAPKEFSFLNIYNVAPSYYGMNAGILLTDGKGHSDSLAATYNNLGHGTADSLVDYPVGAITNARYYALTPGGYRAGFYDTSRLLINM